MVFLRIKKVFQKNFCLTPNNTNKVILITIKHRVLEEVSLLEGMRKLLTWAIS